MPKFLEQALEKGAAKKGFTGARADKYVYGGMNNMGAMRGNKTTAKGEAMEEKHERDMGGGAKGKGRSSAQQAAFAKMLQNRRP